MKEIRDTASSYGIEKITEYDSKTLQGYEGILNILRKLRSSKEYSQTRTSPIIDKLSQVWLLTNVAGANFVDLNRIHRNLFFDITSSDSVEEYIEVKVEVKREDAIPASQQKIPSQVLPFCTQEGILHYVPVAIELIERNFSIIDKIEMEIEEDPETEEKWLLIDIAIRGSVEEAIESYDQYSEDWVSSVPWPERHKIRLSFNII